MVQSVELLLDDDAVALIVREWRLLADAGLPSQARHSGASNRPHVTVAVAQSFSAEVERRLADLVADSQRAGRFPVALRLGGLVLFGGPRAVLARAVVPTAALLDFHARAHEALAGSPGIPPHLFPGRYTPHVTLGMRMRADQVASAAAHVLPVCEDIDTEITGVRRWDGDAKREWTID